MKKHITRKGKEIEISSMSTTHLFNTMRYIERRAKEGVTIRNGGGSCPDDYWCEEYTIYDQDALEHLGYLHYRTEYNKRMNKTP